MIRSAGIIAAGEGSRLKQAGIPVHKPLLEVGGFPLIGHALRHLQEAGIGRAVIIFNEAEQDCADWARQHFPSMALEILVKSTKSSFESFWRVGRALGPGRHLLSTVDSICSPAELLKMTAPVPKSPRDIFLGVTSFVHDEKPLWVETEPGGLKIRALGGPSGNYATAGFYNVSDEVFKRELRDDLTSLRAFLKELTLDGFPTYAVPLADVVDVDTPEDIAIAEQFLKHSRSRT